MGKSSSLPRRAVWCGWLLWSTATIFAGIGCQKRDEWERVVVSGTVRLGQQPLALGRIRFEPTGDTAGPVSIAMIEGGSYRYDWLGGVPVGSHRVRIYASDPDVPDGGGPGGPPPRELVPPKYNAYSKLIVELEPGQKSVVRDFDLE